MIQKLKNNNNGNVEIIRVLSYFFMVVFIAFVLDIIVVMAQNVVTSYEAAYYAEKVSIQGGLLGKDMKYPSVAEAKKLNNVGECLTYQKPCTSCLVNSDMTDRISKTLGYFGVSASEWEGAIQGINGKKTFHSKLNQTAGVETRSVYDYMSTITFMLSTDWQPMFSKFLWGKSKYTISKHVPIVIEYIPQVAEGCENIYLGQT